jgi:hypothetical protein
MSGLKKAGGRCARGIIPMDNDGCLRLKWIEFMHPGGRLGMFVSEKESNLSMGVLGDSSACSSSEAIAHRVVQKVISIEM